MALSTELERLTEIQKETHREIEATLKPHLRKWISLQLTLRKISEWADHRFFDLSSIESEKVVYKTNDYWQGESIVLEIPMEFIDDSDKYIMSSLSTDEIDILKKSREENLETLETRRDSYVAQLDSHTHQLTALRNLFKF